MTKPKEKEVMEVIETALEMFKNPVVLCSFGKDSMVVLHMVSQFKPDIEILFFQDILHKQFSRSSAYIFKTITDLNLDTYTYPPSHIGYIQNRAEFGIYYHYYIDDNDSILLWWNDWINLAKIDGSDRYKANGSFLCAISDSLSMPTVGHYTFKWDCMFGGYKKADESLPPHIFPFWVPQERRFIEFSLSLFRAEVQPLLNWTDEDVWDYIRSNDLPYQQEIYENNPGGKSCLDKNGKLHPRASLLCYECLDYHNSNKTIICPKTGQEIPFAGKSELENRWEINRAITEMLQRETERLRKNSTSTAIQPGGLGIPHKEG